MKRAHTIRVTYSNGAVGTYAGLCPYLPEEEADLGVVGLDIGPIENIDDEVIDTIRKQAADETQSPKTAEEV